MTDIIDRIDELVDESLSAGETVSDYQNGDRHYPRCPHCDRHWHGLKITRRIANMYAWGSYDETYSAAGDDTDVLCEGSNFIGPQRSPHTAWESSTGWQTVGYISTGTQISGTITFSFNGMSAVLDEVRYSFADFAERVSSVDWQAFARPQWRIYDSVSDFTQIVAAEPEPLPCVETPDITVEFGPQNWKYEFQRIPNHSTWCYVVTPTTRVVASLWDKIATPDHPVPSSPGYDFDAIPLNAFSRSSGPALPALGRR